jgi:hypothetical protein
MIDEKMRRKVRESEKNEEYKIFFYINQNHLDSTILIF